MDAEAVAKEYYQSNVGFGLGSQFMAVVFDTLFAGILVCQLTHWLPNLRHDALHIRFIAGFGAAAALSSTIFTWTNYTSTFVYHFGQYARFASFQDLGWYAFLDILTVIPVQMIFAERSIKVNNKSRLVIFLDCFLILGTLGSALGVVITTRNHTMFNATETMRIFLLLWPAICTCTHLTLTSTIVYGLWKYRQGLSQSSSVVDRLIYTCLESQLPATCFAFAAMVTLAVNPKSPIVPWIIIVHPKIFIVGCLAMLNSRHTWQRQGKLPSSGQYSSRGKSSNASSNETPAPATPEFDMHTIQAERQAHLAAAANKQVGLGVDLRGSGDFGTGRPQGMVFQEEQEASAIDPIGRIAYDRQDSGYKV